MLNYLKKYPLSLLIILAILYLSFFNPPQTGMEEIPYIDKVAHICMYGGLCLFIWIEYLRSHKKMNLQRMLVGGIILPILLSGSIEWIQGQYTDNRSGDWADLAANILGVLSAALVGHYLLRPFFWKEKKMKRRRSSRTADANDEKSSYCCEDKGTY